MEGRTMKDNVEIWSEDARAVAGAVAPLILQVPRTPPESAMVIAAIAADVADELALSRATLAARAAQKAAEYMKAPSSAPAKVDALPPVTGELGDILSGLRVNVDAAQRSLAAENLGEAYAAFWRLVEIAGQAARIVQSQAHKRKPTP